MRKYEIMYIIQPTVEEEAKKTLVERFDAILTNNGAEIIESKDWGKRRLAYEINDFREGFYQLITLNADEVALEEFKDLANINENIIRHMTIRIDG